MLVVVCSIVVVVFSPLPTWEGKNNDDWFYGERGNPGLGPTMEAAKEAYLNIGSPIMPFLIEKARGEETAFRRFHRTLFPRLPSLIKARFNPPRNVTYDQSIAWWFLGELRGLLNESHVEELMSIVATLDDQDLKQVAYHLVIAPRAMKLADQETKKRIFLRFLGDAEFLYQLDAAIKLSTIDPMFTNGIPVLTRAIRDQQLVESTFPKGSLNNNIKAKIMQQEAYEALLTIAPEKARDIHSTEFE